MQQTFTRLNRRLGAAVRAGGWNQVKGVRRETSRWKKKHNKLRNWKCVLTPALPTPALVQLNPLLTKSDNICFSSCPQMREISRICHRLNTQRRRDKPGLSPSKLAGDENESLMGPLEERCETGSDQSESWDGHCDQVGQPVPRLSPGWSRGVQHVQSVVLRGAGEGRLNAFYCSVLEGLEKIKTTSTIVGGRLFKGREGDLDRNNEGGQKSPRKVLDWCLSQMWSQKCFDGVIWNVIFVKQTNLWGWGYL